MLLRARCDIILYFLKPFKKIPISAMLSYRCTVAAVLSAEVVRKFEKIFETN